MAAIGDGGTKVTAWARRDRGPFRICSAGPIQKEPWHFSKGKSWLCSELSDG
jgi:hypothetical protein